MRRTFSLLAGSTAVGLVLACGSAQAAPSAQSGVCPTIGTIPAGSTSCNVEIFYGGASSVSTIVNNATPYDGSDDNLVGVINTSSAPISSLTFSGTTSAGGLFGFDGDGAQTYAPLAGSSQFVGDPDITGYGGLTSSGQFVTFTVADGTVATNGICNGACSTGTVLFGASGIAPGGTAWFSLEGPPSLNLDPLPPSPVPPSPVPAPEPASLLLLATGLFGFAAATRKRR